MPGQLTALHVAAAKIDSCVAIWNNTVAVTRRMNATSAGQMLQLGEAKASDAAWPPRFADVVTATDWAQILGQRLSQANCLRTGLARLKANRFQRTAAVPHSENSRPIDRRRRWLSRDR